MRDYDGQTADWTEHRVQHTCTYVRETNRVWRVDECWSSVVRLTNYEIHSPAYLHTHTPSHVTSASLTTHRLRQRQSHSVYRQQTTDNRLNAQLNWPAGWWSPSRSSARGSDPSSALTVNTSLYIVHSSPIGQGSTNARGLGGPKPDPIFCIF